MGDGLLLLPPDANAPADYLWGTVTTVSPLAVRLDGDTVPTIASEDLSGPRELGDRVYCQIQSRRLVVMGPVSRTFSTLRLTSVSDASPTSTAHAVQIGADTGANLRMDNNEIQAANNGSVGTLSLNEHGGAINIGMNSPTGQVVGLGTQTTAEDQVLFIRGRGVDGTYRQLLLYLSAAGNASRIRWSSSPDNSTWKHNYLYFQDDGRVTRDPAVMPAAAGDIAIKGYVDSPNTDTSIPSWSSIASGWTVAVNQFARRGGIVQCRIAFTTTTALAANSAPNLAVAVISAGFRPLFTDTQVQFGSNGGCGYIATDGRVVLSRVGNAVGAGGTLYGGATYILA